MGNILHYIQETIAVALHEVRPRISRDLPVSAQQPSIDTIRTMTRTYLPPASKHIVTAFCRLIRDDFYFPIQRSSVSWSQMFWKGSARFTRDGFLGRSEKTFMGRLFDKYTSDVDVVLLLPFLPEQSFSKEDFWATFQQNVGNQHYIRLHPHLSPIHSKCDAEVGFNVKAEIGRRMPDGTFVKSIDESLDITVHTSPREFDAAKLKYKSLDASLSAFRSRICHRESGCISEQDFDRFFRNVKDCRPYKISAHRDPDSPPERVSSVCVIMMAVGAIEILNRDFIRARDAGIPTEDYFDRGIHIDSFLLMNFFHFTYMFFRDDVSDRDHVGDELQFEFPNWRTHALVLHEELNGVRGGVSFQTFSAEFPRRDSPVAQFRASSDLAQLDNMWSEQLKYFIFHKLLYFSDSQHYLFFNDFIFISLKISNN